MLIPRLKSAQSEKLPDDEGLSAWLNYFQCKYSREPDSYVW